MTLSSPLVASLLLVALVAGCATPETTPTGTGDNATPPTDTPMTPVDKTVTVGDGPTTDVPPKLYTISPSKLELTVNVPVNLTLKNMGRGAHDLMIKGIEGATIKSVEAGKSASVTFTPTQTGTYEMICTIGGGSPASHADNGMKGSVVVS